MKMKLSCLALAACLPALGFAVNAGYMSVPYNVQSVSDKFSDEQCQAIFSSPAFYDIDSDKPVYAKSNGNYQINDYHRLSTTYISKNQRLFYGKQNMSFAMADKKVTLDADLVTLLDLHRSQIRGSFYLPGYCKGNIIGVKQGLDSWNNDNDEGGSSVSSKL